MDVKEKVNFFAFFFLGGNISNFVHSWIVISCLPLLIKSRHAGHVSLQHVLLGLRFSELSWDHSRPEEEGDSHILWLEFDGEEDGTPVNKLLKIYSKQVRKRGNMVK